MPEPTEKIPSHQMLSHPWTEWLPLWLLYVVGLTLLVPRHEPWFDEAQAWLLARDTSWWHLVARFLRYEGTPGLWHTLLRPLAIGGFPYWTMTAFSCSLGASAAYLLLRHSPFPLALRVLFPFSFFLFYQYAIVARNYSLLPPLIFLIAIQHPKRLCRPVPYASLLAFLAQTSLHGAIIAGCLMGLQGWEALRNWKSLGGPARRAELTALVIFTLSGAAVVLQLLRPSDLIGPSVTLDTGVFGIAAYQMLNGAFTENIALTALVLALSVRWFYRRQALLLFLAPTLALLIFFALLYGKPWHEGTLWLVWALALWVSFLGAETEPARERALIGVAVAVVLVVHVRWGAWTYWKDYTEPYSGSQAAARFIKEHGLEGKVLYGTGFFAPALNPYFHRNVLQNYNGGQLPAFFWWSEYYDFHDTPQYISAKHPDYVLVGIKFRPGLEVRTLSGYHRIAAFPGSIWWKNRPYENDSYVLLGRDDETLPPARTVAEEAPNSR